MENGERRKGSAHYNKEPSAIITIIIIKLIKLSHTVEIIIIFLTKIKFACRIRSMK